MCVCVCVCILPHSIQTTTSEAAYVFPYFRSGFPNEIKAYKIYTTCQDDQVSK